jgi:hypothetical protein
VVAGVAYGYTLGEVTAHAATMARWGGSMRMPVPLWLFYTGLFVAIYLMHLFAWYVGLLYRTYQPQFPWVLQQHQWLLKDEQELRALREERRRANRSPPTPRQQPGATRQSVPTAIRADLANHHTPPS